MSFSLLFKFCARDDTAVEVQFFDLAYPFLHHGNAAYLACKTYLAENNGIG